MSGTSADGIDVALVDIDGRTVRVIAFETFPYPPAVRRSILALCNPKTSRVDAICRANAQIGELFAQALIKLCRKKRIGLDTIDLIGSHGQTVWHNPEGRRLGGGRIGSTLQIGEPSVIAQRTGITTVADFRPRDMAAGGQGAPLVPFADRILFAHKRLTRAVQNIGGIANVTFLPAGGAAEDLLAFDTGPGNMITDGLVRLMTKGKQQYDRNGDWAAKGTFDPIVLRELMSHPFLRRRPPKSTGREVFGQAFCQDLYKKATAKKIRPEDLLATATAFTAASIADAYRRFLPATPDQVILSGGGCRNRTLVKMLRTFLDAGTILTTADFGIDPDAREAVSFAILGWATIRGIANNVPAATGARQPVLLGKIIPG
jgi:anhydro-N-acetylmuramic acid kinase